MHLQWLVLCSLYQLLIVAAVQDWTPEFLAQTRGLNCILGNIERDVTFLHGTDSGNFKKLGKVADMDVCALLCCEMAKCEAAFMANRNCFAVTCHSQEHCATAPAHRNKYHPSVVFIKKIKQSSRDKLSRDQSNGSSVIGANKTDKQPTTLAVKANEGLQLSVQSDDDNKDNSENKPAIQPTALANEGMILDIQSGKDNVLKDGITKESAVDNKIAEKHAKIPETPVPEIIDTIPSKDKIQTVKMEEKKTIPTMHEHKTWREKKLKQSRDSLVSAAVVTCSMAFLLSFAAMVAAKIRKRKESAENPEYATVSNTEE